MKNAQKIAAQTSFAKRRLLATSALTVVGLLAMTATAQAAPGANETPNSDVNGLNYVAPLTSDPNIIVTQSPGSLNVDATKVDNSSIYFQSGNLGSASTWNVDQKTATSRNVNFINSLDGTQIDGVLTSNGIVILLDKNGVLFTGGAKINVGGIIASTGTLDAENEGKLLAGENFTISNIAAVPGAAVVNNATINVADSGLAAFVAPYVTNNGTINAKLGKVTLASGDAVTINFIGNELVQIALPANNGLVKNSGQIIANGGIVTLAASTAKGFLDTVVNNTGLIQADTVEAHDGKIILSGGGDRTKIAGSLSATGGVEVHSKTVNITADLTLDQGNLSIDASTINLNGTVRDTDGVAHDATRLSGNAPAVNVKSTDASIQQGVIFSAEGGLVTVSNSKGDTYFGNIIIDKALTLQGDGWMPTLAGTIPGGKIITVSADGVTIRGLELDGQADADAGEGDSEAFKGDKKVVAFLVKEEEPAVTSAYGIYADGVSDLKIFSNYIHDVTKDGIRLINVGQAGVGEAIDEGSEKSFAKFSKKAPAPGILISSNLIEDSGNDGIYAIGSDGVTVKGNTILNSGLNHDWLDNSNAGSGIQVLNSTNTVIGGDGCHEGNTIIGAAWDGVRLSGGDATVEGNTIKDVDRVGIWMQNMTATAADNVVNGTGLFGIGSDWNSATTRLTITGNTIDNTGFNHGAWTVGLMDGIRVSGVSDTVISGNKIGTGKKSLIEGNGIGIYDSTGLSIAGNVVNGAQLDGIFIDPSSKIGVFGNFVSNSAKNGVGIYDSTGITVGGNFVTHSGEDGVHVDNSDDVNVSGNKIFGSGDDGVFGKNSDALTIRGNTILNSGLNHDWLDGSDTGSGIQVLRSTNTVIGGDKLCEGNIIDGAAWDGIRLSGGTATVEGNHIRDVGRVGIWMQNMVATAAHNVVNGTGLFGIGSDWNSATTRLKIIGNTVDNTGFNHGAWTVGLMDGIKVSGVSDTVISGNKIGTGKGSLIEGNGIGVYDSTNVAITANTVSNTNGSAIFVDPSFGIVIGGNTLSGYGRAGVEALNNGDVIITGNDIDGAGRKGVTGIRLNGNDDVTVTGNDVRNNDVGLDASDADNGTITLEDNTFTNNRLGAWFGSGLIDLSGDANTFDGGDTALLFQPAALSQGKYESEYGLEYAMLRLEGDTLGETKFKGQSEYYVDFQNGAFFDGSTSTTGQVGRPVIINGTDADWDGVPGGLMTSAQLAAIEAKIHDFVDDGTVGLIFPGYTNILNSNDIFNIIPGVAYLPGRPTVFITGLPSTGGAALAGRGPTLAALANIEPAAGGTGGGNTAGDFANIEPAAGGDAATSVACWDNVPVSLNGRNVVTINLGGEQQDILSASVKCNRDAL